MKHYDTLKANQTLALKFSQRGRPQYSLAVFFGQLAKQHDRADSSCELNAGVAWQHSEQKRTKNIPSRPFSHLHRRFNYGNSRPVLSIVLLQTFQSQTSSSKVNYHALVSENKTGSSNQRFELSVCIYISTGHSLSWWLFLNHLDEEKIPREATTAAKAINNLSAWILYIL